MDGKGENLKNGSKKNKNGSAKDGSKGESAAKVCVYINGDRFFL